METYNINGVEIQYDTFDLVNLELYTNGVTEIAEMKTCERNDSRRSRQKWH